MDGSTPGGAPTPKLPGNGTSPAATPSVPGAQGGPGEPSAAVSNAVGNAASSIASKALGDSGPQPTGENGELQAGDKVGNGKVMGEDGQVKKSRGRQFVDNAETGGKIAAAVATGGGSAAAGGGGAAAGQAAGKAAAEQAGKQAAKSAGENAAKNAAGNTAKAAQNMSKQAGKSFDSNKMQEAYNKAKDSQAGKQAKEGVIDQAKNKIADKVDEAADKNEALGMAIDEFNDVMNPVTNAVGGLEKALTGDFEGAKEDLKESKEGLKKLRKKLIIRLLIGVGIFVLFHVLIFLLILGPTIGLYMEITEGVSDMNGEIDDVIVDPEPGYPGPEDPDDPYDPGLPPDTWDAEHIIEEVEALISPDILAKMQVDNEGYRKSRAILCSQIPSFKSLSQQRRDMLFTAATLVAMNYKYLGCVAKDGSGKCTQWASCLWYKQAGGGMAALGGCVVCDTFVGWVYNTKANTNIWMGGASQGFQKLINEGRTTEISKDQLRPGDIACSDGHIGIYAGDGYYFHAAGTRAGVIKGACPKFTRFARFNTI